MKLKALGKVLAVGFLVTNSAITAGVIIDTALLNQTIARIEAWEASGRPSE